MNTYTSSLSAAPLCNRRGGIYKPRIPDINRKSGGYFLSTVSPRRGLTIQANVRRQNKKGLYSPE
jgi:hypothetical protein